MMHLVGDAKPLISPDYGGGDIYSINFAVSDFAGLDWVSAEHLFRHGKISGERLHRLQVECESPGGWEQKLEAAAIEQAKALGHPHG